MRIGAVCLFAFVLSSTAAVAAECPGNPQALGVSRVIAVDPTEHTRIGTMQYRETLPLQEGEVVLTFDDGPLPPNTNRVLEILASECVKATYFLVGRMAQTHPDLVRKIYAAGHTIGTHSQDHPLTFNHMAPEKVKEEIDEGIASVTAALGSPDELAPFFRIPGLLRANDVESYLASRSIMTWSADFPADDWKHHITPAEIVRRAMTRLEAKGKGVLLLHDIHPATVAALPMLFKELKAHGYRIVQVVPASADHPKTATLPSQWLMRPSKDPAIDSWPRAVAQIPERAAEPRLPVPGEQVFGIGSRVELAAAVASPIEREPVGVHGRKHAARPALWPRSMRGPSILDLVSREELPAPNPESFGYSRIPVELPPPVPQKSAAASRPARAASSPAFAELRPTIKQARDVTPSTGPWAGAFPVTTAAMPKTAFP